MSIHVLREGGAGALPQKSFCGIVSDDINYFSWFYQESVHDKARMITKCCIPCLFAYRDFLWFAYDEEYKKRGGTMNKVLKVAYNKWVHVDGLIDLCRKERPDYK